MPQQGLVVRIGESRVEKWLGALIPCFMGARGRALVFECGSLVFEGGSLVFDAGSLVFEGGSLVFEFTKGTK